MQTFRLIFSTADEEVGYNFIATTDAAAVDWSLDVLREHREQPQVAVLFLWRETVFKPFCGICTKANGAIEL